MKFVLENQWLSMALRLVLGSIFVYSALPKILDPPAFAHVIWNYGILPSSLIHISALVLPWLELLSGLALMTGVFRRGAALAAAAMLAVFIAALAVNIVRDSPVDCGCFSLALVEKSHDELMAAMKIDIFRDISLLLVALQVFFTPATWPKKSS